MVRRLLNGDIIFLLLGVYSFLIAPLKSSAQVQTEMRFLSDSFVSPSFEATQKTNYQFVGAQLKTDSFSEDNLKMDIAGGVAVGEPLLNYLNISEINFQKSQSQNEMFYFGRKRLQWSELDSRWDFGVWEPVFKWNPLSPERQGLTGIFWQVDRPYYTLGLFASPLYLPDQGPSFEIENGSFVKGNPWFHRPPDSIKIWNEVTNIDYRLEKPNEAQVVMQSSFGMRLSFGDPQNFRGQLSYIYKPANELAMGYQGNLDLANLKGVVDIQPQVFYHSLTGLDLSYKTQSHWRMGLSGIFDHPNKDEIFDSKWTHPVFSDALLLSPFIEWSQDRWGVSFQHLEIFGGQVTEVGDLASPNRPPLMVRYPYQQADQLALMTNYLFSKNRRLTAKVSYTHSQKNDFDLIRLASRLRLSGMWSLMAEMQLVKAGPLTMDNQNEIAQFENNDRLMVGVGYVY
ncbi:MAG: hypothetical protein ACXVCY_03580 [Pseudobdellovibrionaceae bacterium]